MRASIRLLHIDDHLLFAQGVYSLLADVPEIQWMGSATTIAEGLSLCKQLKPDVVLLDYFLPDGHGIMAAQKIMAAHPGTHIVMLTMENSPYIIDQCREIGLSGFLPKTIGKDELTKAIIFAYQRKKTFPDSVQHIRDPGKPEGKITLLSKREKEIALLIAEGLTSSEIAEKLYLSLLTVNTHRRNLMRKLDVKNTAQLSMLVGGWGRF